MFVLQAAMFQKAQEETVPFFLQKLEAILVSSNGGDGYFVGDDVSLYLPIVIFL